MSSSQSSHSLMSFDIFRFGSRLKLCLQCSIIVLLLCQTLTQAQRIDRFSCERRPTHTRALKSPGDNGFSIKILGSPPPAYYEPGKDYQILINGSYSNQQFLDFMLIATSKMASNERQTAGTFTHLLNHMTKEDLYCNHILTSVTFHPSFKKSLAEFIWTAPRKGSGCVLFKATVMEHPDIWFSDDGGLTKMFCEKPEDPEPVETVTTPATGTDDSTTPSNAGSTQSGETNSHNKRQSNKCCACDVAKYEVTFVGNWSRDTHPKNFPPSSQESLLHWSDIIGASHSPSYTIWSYDTLATAGVKEVCEYGWPRTLEGEIKQQSRNVRTVIKASGIWGYPNIYTAKRTARFSTDNERPFVSLLTMVGPSPDWCVGLDSVNLCQENCTWLDRLDLPLYPWDAGTDSGVTYLSNNLPTYPRQTIRPITNTYPNNTDSPFFGEERVRPMATISLRRVGARNTVDPNQRCEASGSSSESLPTEDTEEETNELNPKCMVTEWSAFSACSVTCGVGVKTRTRQFKHPMGSMKMCPSLKLQEMDNCLGLVNECEFDPNEPVDVCITTPWSTWSPCSVTCGSGSQTRTRQYLSPMGPSKCSSSLTDSVVCHADIPDCSKAKMMIDWHSVCKLPAEVGRCVGSFPRFYYDVDMKKCLPFEYGGCRGNQNKFNTMEECERTCSNIMVNEVVDTHAGAVDDIDCMVTEWTAYSECTVTCGTGLRSRTRMIKLHKQGSGAACPKDLYDSVVCASSCPVGVEPSTAEDIDCMLSEWSHWSECTTSCDDGVQSRERMIKRPSQGQGRPCGSDRKEMRPCNLGNCDILDYSQCMISEWAPWSECSVACGTGKQMRRRMEKRGPCPQETIYSQIQPCVGNQCEGLTPTDCVISSWSDWTECDEPCGLGSQTRFRMIIQPAQNGGSCEFEDPKQMEKRTCYLESCDRMTSIATTPNDFLARAPVDCQVSDWGPWSSCSRTCGTGRQIKRREPVIRRRNGGKRCPHLKAVQQCETGIKCRRSRRLRKL